MNLETRTADQDSSHSVPDVSSSADPPTHTAAPGGLHGEVSLLIQTRQAQRLVLGRNRQSDKPEIIGLLRFAQLVRRIWLAAMLDDPYADGYLIRILETLEAAGDAIQASRRQVSELLESCQQLEIAVAQSVSPLRVPLQFANPYGYLGAYLLSDYDELVCTALTARHVALVSRDHSDRITRQGAGRIRSAFASPLGWTQLGITRDDLRQDNARARAAQEKMGPLPPDIVEGERRARIAPAIRKSATVIWK